MTVKTGLVMEGGAMRGLFTCGVIDTFMENGITFNGAIGVSAGATFGCNFKSGQIGRALRYNKKYCRDRRYCSIWSLITTGDLYGADFCYRILVKELDPFDQASFRSNPMDFYIAATDVKTGKPVYHQCINGDDKDITWIRASASMPIVSRPVEVDGYTLLDGGITDSIPYKYMEHIGYNRCVIILTQPDGYQKKKSPALPVLRVFLHRYPAIAEALAMRYKQYNKQINEIKDMESSGKIFVIRPPENLKIGRTEKDPDELDRVYQIGKAEAVRKLAEVKRFLNYTGSENE